jgi:hypothetical protein
MSRPHAVRGSHLLVAAALSAAAVLLATVGLPLAAPAAHEAALHRAELATVDVDRGAGTGLVSVPSLPASEGDAVAAIGALTSAAGIDASVAALPRDGHDSQSLDVGVTLDGSPSALATFVEQIEATGAYRVIQLDSDDGSRTVATVRTYLHAGRP